MDKPVICRVWVIIMTILSELLSSKVRAEVFRQVFGLNAIALHVRELERRSGFAVGTIQTELKKLHRLDLVLKRRDGNRLYYSANQNHPIFPLNVSEEDKASILGNNAARLFKL